MPAKTQSRQLFSDNLSIRDKSRQENFETRRDETVFLVSSRPRNRDEKFLDPSLPLRTQFNKAKKNAEKGSQILLDSSVQTANFGDIYMKATCFHFFLPNRKKR